MLSHLIIRNFAIIEHLEIPFKTGFTVLTGETGAGKSIIIDALNLLLGGRASTEIIRTDEERAIVEGIFEPAPRTMTRINAMLEARGIDPCDEQLVIRRIVSRSGRNKVFINGSLTTASVLSEVASGLVDISGQHEHYSLLNPDGHIELLDEFAQLHDQSALMRQDYEALASLRREQEQLTRQLRERANRIDFLRYQLEEIQSLKLRPGEDESLEQELGVLRHAEKIQDASLRALALCEDSPSSAAQQLSEASGLLARLVPFDPEFETLSNRLEEACIQVEELARDLRQRVTHLDCDPRRLDSVIERLEHIKRLRRKHGSSVVEILERAAQMSHELDRLEHAEAHCNRLEQAIDLAARTAFERAHTLSQARRKAAYELEQALETQLADLNMARTRFVIRFELPVLPSLQQSLKSWRQDPQTVQCIERLSARGFDELEFLIAPNLGEEPKPLARIASGGELSRVMLVMKSAMAERDPVDTYIFDEVDTGIGGSTADMVGLKIRDASLNHQVICITHLPQIASCCDHHYVVQKQISNDRAQSTIRPLSESERVDEVARMLGGTRVTDKTIAAARELIHIVPLERCA